MIVYSDTDSPFMFLDHYGRETRPAGSGYWLRNRRKRNPDGAVVQYLHAGELEHRRGRVCRRAGAGQALLMLNGDNTEYGLRDDARADCRHQWVELRGPGARDHIAQIVERYGPIATDTSQRELLRSMDRLISVGSQFASRDPAQAALAVYRFLLFLHAHMARQADDVADTPARRGIAVLAANPLHPWSLKELAAEVGCTRDHLTRAFALRFGVTPKQWLNDRRLDVALHLLRDSSLPVTAIAEQTGLGTAPTVARLVRRATGLSPRAYRERTW